MAHARIGALQALLDAGPLRGGPGFLGKRVATEVRPANIFYAATDKHQRYLEANPRGYCNHMKARSAVACACAAAHALKGAHPHFAIAALRVAQGRRRQLRAVRHHCW